MKILLIGPCPPPHGGVSVHIAGIRDHLLAAGVTCRVLDTARLRPGVVFGLVLLRYAMQGWTFHLHTNGHNVKSWILAFWCALTGLLSGGCILTLHSGMAPAYLESAPLWRRKMAALACRLSKHVICASAAIRRAVLGLGISSRRTEVLPAFVGTSGRYRTPDAGLLPWIAAHRPLFSTVLFFRPEYGFDTLVAALSRLRSHYPSLGCLVMGSGEQRAEAESQVRAAGLEGSMILLGDVDHEACVALMSACDVFVRPTLEDGDSISVREALSLGKPVVASRVGTRPDGALLFHPGDVDAMVAKIDLALTAKRSAKPRFANCMDRLMEIYQLVDGSEGSLCLN